MQASCATRPWLQVVVLPSKHWTCSWLPPSLYLLMLVGPNCVAGADKCLHCR